MDTLDPIAPAVDAPAPNVIRGDFIDDEPDNSTAKPATKAALSAERDAAMRAEHLWPVWDAEQQKHVRKRLVVSGERWTWWKIMRGHNAPVSAGEDDARELDLDELVPQAWALLWLCLHETDEILDLVPLPKAFWQRVNEWAAVHCPPAQWHEAIALMNAIRSNISVLLTVPLPTRRGRRLGE